MSDRQSTQPAAQKEAWRGQANLVSFLLASLPNGHSITLGDRERTAISDLLDRLSAAAS